MKVCVYPGSFDPVTNGHLDIIDRASRICDRLIVAVLVNASKKPAFTVEERIDFLNRVLKGRSGVEVESFSGLLVDYLRKRQAKVIVKGLRAFTDFEYEFQMALLNKTMDPDIETLFMMTNINYSYLSSSAVKEVARYGGKIEDLVPECLRDDILRKLKV